MYLWKIEYNKTAESVLLVLVVNCFKLCIFERLNTICVNASSVYASLWIALNYVSLKDWIQSKRKRRSTKASCELL